MVRREVRLDVPADRVWRALSSAEGLSAWFEQVAALDLRAGGRAEFVFPDGARRAATIEVLEPPHTLRLRWAPFVRAPDGRAVQTEATTVTFEIAEHPGGATLTVTEASTTGSALRVGA